MVIRIIEKFWKIFLIKLGHIMFDHIYIQNQTKDSPITVNVLKNKGEAALHWYETDAEKQNIVDQIMAGPEPFLQAKKTIFIENTKGGFFNQCPGTKNLICCNYFVINPVIGCNFDCHYCFLQGYTQHPAITVAANLETHLEQLRQWLDKRQLTFFRIGSGELSDSLSMDHILGIAPLLMRYFSQMNNAQLELKTKSANINHLLSVPYKKNTIISFSVNPQSIIDQIEIGTASLSQRLWAARQVAQAGMGLAFHFDPIILHQNWQDQYSEVVDAIFDTVPHHSILYISLGVMRYFKDLKNVLYRRHCQSPILQGPFVPGEDDKWRYYRPIREDIYLTVKNLILRRDPNQWIYFCMEGTKTWKNVFGMSVSSKRNIDKYFSLRRRQFLKYK